MKHFLILISCLLLLISCSKDEAGSSSVKVRRTVLVFISGENNLSPFVENDLKELATGRRQVGQDEDLIVFVDKASSTEKPFIGRITTSTKQPIDTLFTFDKDFYSSDPTQFRQILQWVVNNCPATEDYGLVLWGHANGWFIREELSANSRRAYGMDYGTDESSTNKELWLNIPTIRQVCEQIGIKWKFIFCDCCSMQCAEVAYELRNVCDYFIASPSEISGLGAPYDVIVKDFFMHNDQQMYTAICDDYYDQVTHELRTSTDEHLPISVVKTHDGSRDNMQALADSTRKLLPLITANLGMPRDDFERGFIYYYRQLFIYNGRYEYRDDEIVCYDMRDVIQTALKEHPQAFNNWLKAFNQAVVYSRKSAFWHGLSITFSDFDYSEERQGVMSMFFPLGKYSRTKYPYNDDIKKMAWYQAVGWSELGW